MRRRWRAAGVVLAVTALTTIVVAGATAAQEARHSTQKLSTLVFGTIATISNPAAGASGVPIRPGLQAWQKWTNAHGGIAGHPVKVIVLDDAGDPTKALTDIKQLVDQDHIMALIGSWGFGTDVYVPYAEKHGVPVIESGDSYAPPAPLTYQIGTTQADWIRGTATAAKLAGAKYYGFAYCAEIAACKDATPIFQNAAQSQGLKFTSVAVSGTAPNYTAQCLSLKSAGVDAVELAVSLGPAVNFAESCAQQGYHPLYVTGPSGFAASVASNSALDGMIGVLTVFPWFEDDTPATKLFHQAIARYAPTALSVPDANAPNLAAVWAAGQAVAFAGKHFGPHPTRRDLINSLDRIKHQTYGGLTPPNTFTKTTKAQPPTKCFFVIQLKNGHYGKLAGHKSYAAC